MSTKKINAMQIIRDAVTRQFDGTNNILVARIGNMYEAQGRHNVEPLQDIGVKKFKRGWRTGIPVTSIHNVNENMTKNGYNMHVIYRGEAGAVHYHPFETPIMIDRRSELSQQQRDRLQFSKLLRSKEKKVDDVTSEGWHHKNGKPMQLREKEINSWVRHKYKAYMAEGLKGWSTMWLGRNPIIDDNNDDNFPRGGSTIIGRVIGLPRIPCQGKTHRWMERHSNPSGDSDDSDDDVGVNFLNGIAIPITNKANL
tara:strand:- start:165 stop:926 length:762 start_codon:yes stop_codon:yes gene_type:complete